MEKIVPQSDTAFISGVVTEYSTLSLAQQDIANIPDGYTCWVKTLQTLYFQMNMSTMLAHWSLQGEKHLNIHFFAEVIFYSMPSMSTPQPV